MKRTISFMGTLLLGFSLTSTAATLEDRIEALEKQRAELYHDLEERKGAGLMTKITEKISISGLLEVEAYYENLEQREGDDDASSDLVLATAQLGFEAEVTDHLGASLVFLFEEDETDLEVDEGTIDYSRDGWSARAGRFYVPFGVFVSHMVSDPLTLELGETRETAISVGFEHDFFAVSAFLFNGDAERGTEEDHIKDWGASIQVSPVENLEFGASFLSDIADTDAELVDTYRDRVPGGSAFFVAGFGPVAVNGEFLGALQSFDEDDLDVDGDGSGDQPVAWNLEAAWYIHENVEISARVEGSDEFADQPEIQYGVGASWGPWEYVSLSIEYLRGEFDKGFGGGVDSRDLVTGQLAAEF